ncbi:hypothetical protein CBP36_21200 (plasmid) [Acidovorax carolinensis]|uniref:ParB-like N-terminal domain-containing protein n=1 Tax=Acidovorax carolinensis TaxID=553814 RepID=A0A240UJ10_9BURK|nr:ParB/RepB/Spo0J family partition protein [Acidovorax carolinensis]ART61487.1 hypothetical protein CBP36_21200 [Acidovorax carolinensis]
MTSKRKSIGEQVASIDMTEFEKRKRESAPPPSSPVTSSAETPTRPHTGVGMVLNAITDKGNLERELADTKQRLAEYQESELVRSIDPATIRRSVWANRLQENFAGQAWDAFKAEIESAGGNVEPIKVRRVFYGKTRSAVTQQHNYEIVFGHRRHQACLELGMPVKAVIVESMDDKSLFVEMDRENRVRQNLSAWEQGRMYNNALQEGLFPSIRQLAQELGVNLSNASRSCKLAQLPDEVVNAFQSPLVLQVRWAKDLADALQADEKGLLDRARELHTMKGKLKPAEVLSRLLAATNMQNRSSDIEINSAGKKAASLKVGANGRAVVEFEAGVLNPEKHQALAQLIAEFLHKEET